ncbi:retron Ec78 anti-phage system effector HNH endonuclease PtuB [Photobacterium kishitanii]|uniref:retron Ec78 anti-phage system effector HNH endonuclease PtuB n=1 Tax=Photobacterium kishitanii TaxID=318456 RepID=UPI0015E659F3|nr:retron Ec78 anti-phage system effector HNH endonuclease PtuB [Photobacterium kishitanii]
MRKINKTQEDDNELIIFSHENPNASWEDFRHYNSGKDYDIIKEKIFINQSQLCAYCETSLDNVTKNNKRIEHFRSKSDKNATHNIALDWNNIIGVCLGGTDNISKKDYELPTNLSCDSYKAYIEDKESIKDKDWNGKILSPLTIPDAPLLFVFDKLTGKLFPDEENCKLINIENNIYSTTRELIERTINVFNLNCERLNKARLIIFRELQRRLKSKNLLLIENFTKSWNRSYPLSFQTTRDIILKDNKITSRFL